MSHNSRFKPGPTLKECREQGVTHIEVQCLTSRCRRLTRFEIDNIRARDDVPVNHIRFVCSGCRQINISVEAIRPAPVETAHPIFDTSKVKPKERRLGVKLRIVKR